MGCKSLLTLALVLAACGGGGSSNESADAGPRQKDPPSPFINWENLGVHPLDVTPDGNTLLVCNTPDNRLEIFDISTMEPVLVGSVSVGLDPVSVRARSDTEAWVVNHISDSVSVVNLTARRIVATLQTLDEPSDLIFAGGDKAYVSCSQANAVQVFCTGDLAAAPVTIQLDGEEPRAMAVGGSGDVYVACFESGNRTTILMGDADDSGNVGFPQNVVDDPEGPHDGVNPPPNDGAQFSPPQRPGNPAPPKVSLIVKQQGDGSWRDDTSADWSEFVDGAKAARSGRKPGWELLDRDVAVIDKNDNSVRYVSGCMNLCMAIAVHDGDEVLVAGTDATNDIRFEPILKGRFLRVNLAKIGDGGAEAPEVTDLNPHLDYTASTIAQGQRDLSIGDPRGIAVDDAAERTYITGMGSNNVVVLDGARNRVGVIEVGEGPTGIVLAHNGSRAYVLNRFEASISTIDTGTLLETGRLALFDPTPDAIKLGRRHLYDTHATSGLGHIACASCHVDARTDRLSWDLGDPAGEMKSPTDTCFTEVVRACEDYHPMKGPMLTQTLQDIIGLEPHHWRGDRLGLEEFNGAFGSLMGDDENPDAAAMQEFEDFLAGIHFPPNPFRNLDNTLPDALPLTGHFTTGRFGAEGQPLPPGNANRGLDLFRTGDLDGGIPGFQCVTCHTLPVGVGADSAPRDGELKQNPLGKNGERHHALISADGFTNVTLKTPHMRNLYERVGFRLTRDTSRMGFGFDHDGAIDSIERFVSEPVFAVTSSQQVADVTAFLLAFSGSDLPMGTPNDVNEPLGPESRDSHAAVGKQLTIGAAIDGASLDELVALAVAGVVELVAKGGGGGWLYDPATQRFLSDTDGQSETLAGLKAAAGAGNEITFTVVPLGMGRRVGIDRDLDGFGDATETAAGSDPADAGDRP